MIHVFSLLLLISSFIYPLNQGIICKTNGFVGDNIASLCLGRVLSIKYNIPLYLQEFEHCELFDLYARIPSFDEKKFTETIIVRTEKDILDNLDKNNVAFRTFVATRLNGADPICFTRIKQDIQLKNRDILATKVNVLPTNMKTVALHIRKGNGGGQYYDGEQFSLQLFDFDRSQVVYDTFTLNYPFEWPAYNTNQKTYTLPHEKHLFQERVKQRNYFCPARLAQSVLNSFPKFTALPVYQASISTAGYRFPTDAPIQRLADQIPEWQMRFPPDQFYVDQLQYVSQALNDEPLFVQIYTDDKFPDELIERIKKAVNKANITYYYQNVRTLPFKEQIELELYSMSRHDILIRSHSYFATTAEMMGNYKLVIYPTDFKWDNNKLIMNKVMWHGSLLK